MEPADLRTGKLTNTHHKCYCLYQIHRYGGGESQRTPHLSSLCGPPTFIVLSLSRTRKSYDIHSDSHYNLTSSDGNTCRRLYLHLPFSSKYQGESHAVV